MVFCSSTFSESINYVRRDGSRARVCVRSQAVEAAIKITIKYVQIEFSLEKSADDDGTYREDDSG